MLFGPADQGDNIMMDKADEGDGLVHASLLAGPVDDVPGRIFTQFFKVDIEKVRLWRDSERRQPPTHTAAWSVPASQGSLGDARAPGATRPGRPAAERDADRGCGCGAGPNGPNACRERPGPRRLPGEDHDGTLRCDWVVNAGARPPSVNVPT